MKKKIFAILLFTITVLGWSLYAQSADYPVRAIQAVVPYTAGGSTDVVFRAIVAEAEKFLGQPIAITNIGGGGGSVGSHLGGQYLSIPGR
jgi:tripartite-type tricarboxylate transporter receptor subunit TctC